MPDASLNCPRPVDDALTGRVKAHALSGLRADLVGIANIERFAKAPPLMSPQGIMPSAQSVVVMAIHHPDACVEIGGLKHPQEIGSYRVQYLMNSRLDEISYRMAMFLERQGWQAIPIVSSNIWRYKGYKELTEQFAPDISHRHAAVAAGLADFGYSALAITPEYGARQRFVSIITDARLTPTPLVEPGSVCDMCKLCVKHCMAQALSKEIDGISVVEIEDKKYTYANKNLWRCSWGEHFDLDLDLPLPDVVDEDVILEQVRIHGRRGGEMGSCLRYCVPAKRRYFQADYTDAPRRVRATPQGDEDHRGKEERIRTMAFEQGVDFVMVTAAEDFTQADVDVHALLPDAVSAVTLGLHYRKPEGPDTAGSARSYLLDGAAYDVTRELERMGYSAVCSDFPESIWGGRITGAAPGRAIQTATILTSAPLTLSSHELPPVNESRRTPQELTSAVKRELAGQGADMVRIIPAGNIAELAPQLTALFGGQEYFIARDVSGAFLPYEPEITRATVQVRTPQDHLANARSVIVVGLRLPRMSVDCTAKPPAEAVGPYAFAQYESANMLRLMGLRVMRTLEDMGARCTLSFDLEGTGSVVANPRGEQPDAFCNRFTAVAAGLGHITKGGFVNTPELGPNVRFLAIITDADLAFDEIAALPLEDPCQDCTRCLDACQTAAFGTEATVTINGVEESFVVHDRSRCDWAKRYSLIGDEGVSFLGWDLNIPAPEKVTREALDAALRQQPPIPKYRPCAFEACVLSCPLARQQSG